MTSKHCAALAILWGGAVLAAAQTCVGAEPASGNCQAPRQIPATTGHHVILMDTSTALGSSNRCGVTTSNEVWFELIAQQSGPVTISTCHPATDYDTVLAVYSGGDAFCDFMTLVECNDDTFKDECSSTCSGRASEVTFQATFGVQYRIVVGRFGSGGGCGNGCLGLIASIGQPCGEPARNIDAAFAFEIPGNPGSYEFDVDAQGAFTLPSEPVPSCAGPAVGHTTWYSVTPERAGLVTLTTCTPQTTFDTVVAAYQELGPGTYVHLDCNDDDFLSGCINACGSPAPRGSRVTIAVDPNETYLFQVGSYNENSAGCTLCLGVQVEVIDQCDIDLTPPLAQLDAPSDFSCGCSSVQLNGTAEDGDGTFDRYYVEYRAAGGSAWTLISQSTAEVSGGQLATWNPVGLAQGYYQLRLTAENACGRASTDMRTIWVDGGFDVVNVRQPAHGAVVRNRVCLDGTITDNNCFAQYTAEYRPIAGGALQPVDPCQPSYASAVINDPFAWWETGGLADGDYELLMSGLNVCGRITSTSHVVTVDNTPPTALISSPLACDQVGGIVQIVGTVDDPHLLNWTLDYASPLSGGWVPINNGTSTVFNGVLGNWDTSGLPDCGYTLRLRATDTADAGCGASIGNVTLVLRSVRIGSGSTCPGDVDGDLDVDLTDLAILLTNFGLVCP